MKLRFYVCLLYKLTPTHKNLIDDVCACINKILANMERFVSSDDSFIFNTTSGRRHGAHALIVFTFHYTNVENVVI